MSKDPLLTTQRTLQTLVLGTQASKIFPPTFLRITSVSTGDLWKAFGVPASIFVWLLGLWFFALSSVSILSGIRKLPFTLHWWAFIFPNAGLKIAAIQIGNVLGSNGIKGDTSGMTILLVIMWLYVAAMNVWAVWKRQILWPGKDEGMEDIEGHVERSEELLISRLSQQWYELIQRACIVSAF
jgi:tellurite resistance protein TehA-like permease